MLTNKESIESVALKSDKSPGHDNLHLRVVKAVAMETGDALIIVSKIL